MICMYIHIYIYTQLYVYRYIVSLAKNKILLSTFRETWTAMMEALERPCSCPINGSLSAIQILTTSQILSDRVARVAIVGWAVESLRDVEQKLPKNSWWLDDAYVNFFRFGLLNGHCLIKGSPCLFLLGPRDCRILRGSLKFFKMPCGTCCQAVSFGWRAFDKTLRRDKITVSRGCI